jgi:heptosyltransferase III
MDFYKSILVVRRDNIGDLVCTTPLLSALRRSYPQAWIGVLANSYNAPVLEGNSDLDGLYSYQKLKHLESRSGAISALAGRIRLLWSLRQKKLDLVVLAAGAQDLRAAKLARFLSPRRIICSEPNSGAQHEVERTFSAARTLGFAGDIPPLRIEPLPPSQNGLNAINRAAFTGKGPVIGLHVSARRPAQRWPAEKFAELAIALSEKFDATTLLFWSPGDDTHAHHPGDDIKAAAILAKSRKARLMPWPTVKLTELIGGLAGCDALVCSDGGAMHVAAGLGKPIVCFFGDSQVDRWRPWGVPHIVLQAGSRQVADISVHQTISAITQLLKG